MKEDKRVILRINTARVYGRNLLAGIGRYAALHPEWHFFRQTPEYVKRSSRNQELERIRAWRPHGAIQWDSEDIAELLEMDIPLILSPNLIISQKLKEQIQDKPYIATDCEAISVTGAEYLLDKGFHHFAFCGFHGQAWSIKRENAFMKRIAQAGYQTYTFKGIDITGSQIWQNEIRQMAQWIKQLPKPLAIMACNDDRGFDVIEACKQAGCYMPEEVAVLGVDNEEQACKVINPALSSIFLNAQNAGFKAAMLLDRMMDGYKPLPEERWISVLPLYVVTRQSTDVLAINDPLVAEAIHFIQSNIYRKIHVDDVIHQMEVSRRNLEQRFQNALGRTIHAEIRRLSVNKMIELLVDSQMSVNEISQALGHEDAHNLSRFFKKETGTSPMAYRKEHSVF